jgi:predicted lipoprotein
MKLKKLASLFYAGVMVVLAGVMLIGCKRGQPTPAAVKDVGSTFTSQTLTMSYTGALNASNQLMLGMLKLEGTDNAITSEQAKAMLRVMPALQGQVLTSDAERNAAWANIEAQLTQAQIGAIANMHLTQDDLQTWTRDNSRGSGAGPMPGGPAPQGTPGAGPMPGGAGSQGTPGAGPGQGGARPQGTFGAPPSFGGAAGGSSAGAGQGNVLLNAVIRLLTNKSAGIASPPGSRAATPTPTAP